MSHIGIVLHVERCIILLMESINTTGTKMKERLDLSDVEACNFILSLRGRLILGQALTIAVNELSKVEGAHRQVGNIADMQMLLDSDLPIDLEAGEIT